MAQAVYWDAPTERIYGSTYEDIDEVRVYGKDGSAPTIPTDLLATIDARDGYDNWVTGYLHNAGATTWQYKIEFYLNSVKQGSTLDVTGYTPGTVTVWDVLNFIQGVPSGWSTYYFIHLFIEYVTADVESHIRQRLSSTTVTKEKYSGPNVIKVLSYEPGRIRLRHFPVISVDNIYIRQPYNVDDSGDPVDTEITTFDPEILNQDEDTGFNRGAIQVWLRQQALPITIGNVPIPAGRILSRYPGYLMVSYTHGWATWPDDLKWAVMMTTAGNLLDILADASGSGGLSSQSIDAVTETFTASATTTMFSARRIAYDDKTTKILSRYKKRLVI